MAEKLDYKSLSTTDLESRLKETQEDLVLARRNFRLGKFKKTSDFSRLRREVARIKTFLNKTYLKVSVVKEKAA